ncbi:redoxin domain-containing protein [Candidatus Berkiella cookevillensis]|uniref:Redoxin domain-containing protein n=1 Tax=Candidatus Berkiella cookevillensis TaxID=437022 RepID=A0A0Q9Y974_9GAMM|nr:redoxin domain-containing protein [Candidatus Berkiella cookevillensis]MCS5707358.1 redoxin domain-containing protein [Candidatus Berkiella cookevillensis]
MIKHKLKAIFVALTTIAAFSLFQPIVQAAVQVGAQAPEFSGTTADGKTVKLSDYKGKVVVLEWNNPFCPFVRKHYDAGNMQALQKEYTAKDIIWLSINSSAKGKQGYLEGTALDEQLKKDANAATAYIVDAEGTIGRLYEAKTTPQMFVISKEGTVMYNGAIDSISSADISDIAKADPYVKNAIDATIKGQSIKISTSAPYGCSVKYSDAH